MSKYIPPYNFVSIEVPIPRRKPIWHDCFPKKQNRSGRIRCTAYALTPLLAGAEQIAFADMAAGSEEEEELKRLAGNNGIDPAHKLLRPFRFPDTTLGIADSSLKGMIANVYAAITQSPIERVNERTFSFRPNICFGGGPPEPRAGIVYKENEKLKVLAFRPIDRDFKKDDNVGVATRNWLRAAVFPAATIDLPAWIADMPAAEILLPCTEGGSMGRACCRPHSKSLNLPRRPATNKTF